MFPRGNGLRGFAVSFPSLESRGQCVTFVCCLCTGAIAMSQGCTREGMERWCLPRQAEQWAASEAISVIHIVTPNLAPFYIR